VTTSTTWSVFEVPDWTDAGSVRRRVGTDAGTECDWPPTLTSSQIALKPLPDIPEIVPLALVNREDSEWQLNTVSHRTTELNQFRAAEVTNHCVAGRTSKRATSKRRQANHSYEYSTFVETERIEGL